MVARQKDINGNANDDGPLVTLKVLNTAVLDIRVCLNLEQVIKVLPLMALQAVPQAPHYVQGMMNLAGCGVPVFDLAQRLGFTNTQAYNLNTPVILCDIEGKRAGLIVRQVLGVACVQISEMPIDELFQGDSSLLSGVVNVDGDLSMLLKLQDILKIDLASNLSVDQVDLCRGGQAS
jgi:purine-binding chemotaxis protein CheW